MKTLTRELLQTFWVVVLGGALILIALSALSANAATANLIWDHSPDPTVKGYRIYWATTGGVQTPVTNMVQVAYTNKVSFIVPDATTIFYATSFATNDYEFAESVPSNVLTWSPLARPTGVSNFTLIVTGIYR